VTDDSEPALAELVAAVIRRRLPGARSRTLVAIDGPDAAGKTMLADALVDRLDRAVVRASVDGFHRPRHERLARGELSPEGCYRDTFDLDALTTELLDPFAAGSSTVVTAVFDHGRDAVSRTATHEVPAEAVLVVDGVFLLRPELRSRWDVAIHLDVPPETTLERALRRDVGAIGDAQEVRRRYTARYLPAQELYRAEAAPAAYADLVVDARDPAHPVVLAER
jgi:uridine kinase